MPPRQDLRPFLGTPVSLWVGDDDTVRWRFVLDASLQRTAVLRPADDAARDWASRLAPGTQLRLGAGDVDGFVVCELFVDRWSGPQRMLLVTVPRRPDFLQRRSVFRVPVQVQVEVLTWDGGGPARTVGTTKDLSIDGMAAHGVLPAPRGVEALVLLKLPDRPILVGGRVLDPGERNATPMRMHLHLVAPAERRELSGFLRKAEVDRARLARVRTA